MDRATHTMRSDERESFERPFAVIGGAIAASYGPPKAASKLASTALGTTITVASWHTSAAAESTRHRESCSIAARHLRSSLDSKAIISWLPPKGMKARIDTQEPRDGGKYRMTLAYDEPDHSVPGKTSEHTDVVRGQFLGLVPNERIVQSVEFESDDPAFAGAMTMIWTLTAIPGGIQVAIHCEDVPEGIRPEDHEAGFRSTLENLAVFTEAR